MRFSFQNKKAAATPDKNQWLQQPLSRFLPNLFCRSLTILLV